MTTAHRFWPTPLPLRLLAALPDAADLQIGLPVDTAAHGGELIAGAYLAIAHHHQAGGAPVRGLWYDDRRNAEGGRAAAEHLARAGVRYVVGHFSSSAAIVAARIYANRDLLFVAPGSSSPELTALSSGGTIFRLCGRDDAQGSLIVHGLQGRETDQPVEVYAEDNRYGRSVSGLLASMLQRAQMPYRMSIIDTPNGLVTGSRSPVVLAGTHEFSSRLLQQLDPQRCRIATDDAYTPIFLREAGAMAEDVLVPFMGSDPNSDQVLRLNTEYSRLLGIAPGGYFLSSYVAVNLILDAIRTLGDCGGPRIADHLRSRTWTTLLGPLSFDRSGEVHGLAWQLARVQKGQFIPIPRNPSDAGAAVDPIRL
nr:ABC transporter substrate-binding protein [Bradyrhizobium sp. 2S1]MCK7664915.1 ABC transporter substrate-binding protein [Bradyrhizobium sp. 2S1]